MKQMNDNHNDTVKAAHHVADNLDQRGHIGHAQDVRAVLGRGHVGSIFLTALRDTCQVVLTAIEAIDPVSAIEVEELRLKVDARLKAGHGTPPA
jgi:hypothetical protein